MRKYWVNLFVCCFNPDDPHLPLGWFWDVAWEKPKLRHCSGFWTVWKRPGPRAMLTCEPENRRWRWYELVCKFTRRRWRRSEINNRDFVEFVDSHLLVPPVVDLEPKKKLQSAAFTFFSNVPESSSWLTLKMETVALMWRSLRTLKSSPCFWSPMNSRPNITSMGYVGRFSSSWNHPEIYSVVVVCFPLDLQIHLFTSY